MPWDGVACLSEDGDRIELSQALGSMLDAVAVEVVWLSDWEGYAFAAVRSKGEAG